MGKTESRKYISKLSLKNSRKGCAEVIGEFFTDEIKVDISEPSAKKMNYP